MYNSYGVYGTYGPSYGQMEQIALDQRAQAIGDMYGASPEDFRSFSHHHGGIKWGKALAYTIGGLAIAAAGMAIFAAATTAASTVALVTILGGVFGAAISIGHDQSVARRHYANYLSSFSHHVREAHERQLVQAASLTPSVEPEQNKPKQWAADVEASRAANAAAGVKLG
jgi:hypothetical protein